MITCPDIQVTILDSTHFPPFRLATRRSQSCPIYPSKITKCHLVAKRKGGKWAEVKIEAYILSQLEKLHEKLLEILCIRSSFDPI